jgi:hypothetical protein
MSRVRQLRVETHVFCCISGPSDRATALLRSSYTWSDAPNQKKKNAPLCTRNGFRDREERIKMWVAIYLFQAVPRCLTPFAKKLPLIGTGQLSSWPWPYPVSYPCVLVDVCACACVRC